MTATCHRSSAIRRSAMFPTLLGRLFPGGPRPLAVAPLPSQAPSPVLDGSRPLAGAPSSAVPDGSRPSGWRAVARCSRRVSPSSAPLPSGAAPVAPDGSRPLASAPLFPGASPVAPPVDLALPVRVPLSSWLVVVRRCAIALASGADARGSVARECGVRSTLSAAGGGALRFAP